MRHITTALAAIAVAAAVTATSATPALAARGTLTVSGNTYHNPERGCYIGKFRPLSVNNQTNVTVLIYDGIKCNGRLIGRLGIGRSHVFEFGSSVYVPR
ncbi:hypothetical protein AGRA3207_003735 [Actinomadura graeca]|uniref:Secreted protein n=1 Tax=Actinomadura graeca TaxID=2750812 RepID=A0ABX8QV51_9ACTN|nr:hypothetical protein [Actinomadura graeca]QXJ22690.1 hypothetical protein AGRA3207_003735 [Actinomadura graeca]